MTIAIAAHSPRSLAHGPAPLSQLKSTKAHSRSAKQPKAILLAREARTRCSGVGGVMECEVLHRDSTVAGMSDESSGLRRKGDSVFKFMAAWFGGILR